MTANLAKLGIFVIFLVFYTSTTSHCQLTFSRGWGNLEENDFENTFPVDNSGKIPRSARLDKFKKYVSKI